MCLPLSGCTCLILSAVWKRWKEFGSEVCKRERARERERKKAREEKGERERDDFMWKTGRSIINRIFTSYR